MLGHLFIASNATIPTVESSRLSQISSSRICRQISIAPRPSSAYLQKGSRSGDGRILTSAGLDHWLCGWDVNLGNAVVRMLLTP